MPRAKAGYTHAGHIHAVLQQSGVRLSKRLVLAELCRCAEFDRPEVTITKEQLCSMTGLCVRSVRMALQELRQRGIIVPVRHFEGGRGRAVTYRLVAIGQGGDDDATRSEGRATVDPVTFSRWVDLHGYATARQMKREQEKEIQ